MAGGDVLQLDGAAPQTGWGECIVVKTPGWYMLWCGAQKSHVQEWGEGHSDPWGSCQPESSPHSQRRFLRLGEAEMAMLSGEQLAACLWDRTKFFEFC